MKIHIVPAFNDNYIFVAEHEGSAMVVDPGDSAPVIKFIHETSLRLDLILATHHHADHIGGVAELTRLYGSAVFGPETLEKEGLKCDRVLVDGDFFWFGSREFKSMHLPGHTLDHMSYFSQGDVVNTPILFCGDVLFSLGCGRLFEGTNEQMFKSLSRIKALPTKTEVYCAHEYTMQNLRFTIDFLTKTSPSEVPHYEKIRAKLNIRRQNGPTIPSSLEFETQNNLFLRASSLDEFSRVRTARNQF